MKQYPRVLTIAGSDCSGGAGIQADIKTISSLGGYACSAITAVTAQNTLGVYGIYPIPAAGVKKQIEAVMTDIHPQAIKIGMVNDPDIIEAIATTLLHYKPTFVVVDPVMVSTSGCKLMQDEAIDALKAKLFPLATMITPNLSEASVLTGKELNSEAEMQQAALELLNYGCRSVLIKGGQQDEIIFEVLRIKDEGLSYTLRGPMVKTKNTHGTGCTLSSAIATYLALGESLYEAVRKAKQYVYNGICAGRDVHTGEGHGPLNHFHDPQPLKIQE